jgi:hypothetical protein
MVILPTFLSYFIYDAKVLLATINLTHAMMMSASLFFLSNLSNLPYLFVLSQSYFISDTFNLWARDMNDKYLFILHHFICVMCEYYAIYLSCPHDTILLYYTLAFTEVTNLPYLSAYLTICRGKKKSWYFKWLVLLQVIGFLIIRPIVTVIVLYNIEQKYLILPASIILIGSLNWGWKAMKSYEKL